MKLKHLLFFLFLSLISCQQVIEETSKIVSEQAKPKLKGKYHSLQKENVKIFLPEGFKYITHEEYKNVLKQIGDSTLYNAEVQRLDNIKINDKKLYIFEYPESASTLNVLVEKYLPFNKEDGKYLLGIISTMQKNTYNIKDLNTELKEARVMGNKNLKIFKAIYKFTNPSFPASQKFFRHYYLISYNKKTLFLNMESTQLIDFDPYLRKIKM
ncbi:hypothetical protein NHF50_10960 [Flavobacterium sp. NRK F10]|uniref:hypothetical protein n=1 Tax=Flavobacterium sp. NRK F10 TaxID=2954931 RepID=UPI002090AAE4|nr:hypothetical protein [Flavobacterium sp. NRK F10]MCO6175561.1 hypothetical protein [Flavobacterium sp. NRK F10]